MPRGPAGRRVRSAAMVARARPWRGRAIRSLISASARRSSAVGASATVAVRIKVKMLITKTISTDSRMPHALQRIESGIPIETAASSSHPLRAAPVQAKARPAQRSPNGPWASDPPAHSSSVAWQSSLDGRNPQAVLSQAPDRAGPS
jgi:hypothetical protein